MERHLIILGIVLIAIAIFVFVLDLKPGRATSTINNAYIDGLTDPKLIEQLGGLQAVLFKVSQTRPGDVIVKLFIEVHVSQDYIVDSNPRGVIDYALARFRQLGWSVTFNFEHGYAMAHRPGILLPIHTITRQARIA